MQQIKLSFRRIVFFSNFKDRVFQNYIFGKWPNDKWGKLLNCCISLLSVHSISEHHLM